MKNKKYLIPNELKPLIRFSIMVAILVIMFYFINFHNGLSTEQEVWGQFGDYIGGTLNPLFSLAALFALLRTISLQSKQINDTEKQLETQKFQTNFFQMLTLFNDVKKK
jgi:hypothetical protein